MVFEHGKIISVELSNALKDHITNKDRAYVAEKTGLSLSTVRDLMYRTGTVTANNEVAIIELTRRALENCKATSRKFIENKKHLSKVV